jgi:hypothetical protein
MANRLTLETPRGPYHRLGEEDLPQVPSDGRKIFHLQQPDCLDLTIAQAKQQIALQLVIIDDRNEEIRPYTVCLHVSPYLDSSKGRPWFRCYRLKNLDFLLIYTQLKCKKRTPPKIQNQMQLFQKTVRGHLYERYKLEDAEEIGNGRI